MLAHVASSNDERQNEIVRHVAPLFRLQSAVPHCCSYSLSEVPSFVELFTRPAISFLSHGRRDTPVGGWRDGNPVLSLAARPGASFKVHVPQHVSSQIVAAYSAPVVLGGNVEKSRLTFTVACCILTYRHQIFCVEVNKQSLLAVPSRSPTSSTNFAQRKLHQDFILFYYRL